MKRFWCCRDLEGAANEEVFLFVGEEPPIMDDDGEWLQLNMMMNGILLMKRQMTLLG